MINFFPVTFVAVAEPWPLDQSRNLSEYLRPDEETALLIPRKCWDGTFLMVVVRSSIPNWAQRTAIRESWALWLGRPNFTLNFGQLVMSVNDEITPKFLQFDSKLAHKLVFLIGRELHSNQPNIYIMKEQYLNEDLLMEDFVDSYQNLTLQSCFILKYIRNKCPGAKYVATMDDDMFLNLPGLQNQLLHDKSLPDKLVMGRLLCNSRPVRDPTDKLYCPDHMFTGDIYPNYVSGRGYVISGNLIPRLLEAALVTPLFHMEDIYITGILTAKIGVRPTDSVGFSHEDRDANPCLLQVGYWFLLSGTIQALPDTALSRREPQHTGE